MNNWRRTFLIIWTGQLFSTLSSSIVGFSVVLWLSIQTQSAQVLAYAMIAALLPQLVFGLFTGVYVDRWNRKLTMILADSFIAFCTAILGILFYLGTVEVWHVYLLLSLRSVGAAFHTPAMQASTPLLAPESELMRISGINQVIYSISNIAGPALAALLLHWLTMTYIVSIDIIGAAIACISLLFVHIPNPEKSDAPQSIVRELKEGLKSLFARKGISWLLACDVISMFFIIPVAAMFPLITLKHFHGNELHMSYIESGWGIGMFIGGILIGMKYLKHQKKTALIAFMCMVDGITFLLSGFLPSSWFVMFLVLTVFGGIAASIWNGAFTVLLQTKIDADKLGRAFSTYDSLMLMPSIPGLLATGYIAENVGLLNSLIISGIAMIVTGIMMYTIPAIRSLDD